MNGYRFSMLFFIALVFVPLVALAAPQKGEPAPPFKVTSTTGQQIVLSDYRGKVLLLEFFTTWCSSCKDSVSHLVKLHQKYEKQGLQVLGLNLDDDGVKIVREFATANRLNYPVALAGESMQTDYGLRSVPTLYVIGKKGLIAEKFMGYNEEVEKRLDLLLRKLLSE
ncbi:TlpA family protein disulfide reductase [Geobacter pelophilus]|uniref:TlpA family protein disulfide reductase n=1 Tax=Geoanaerobacter pelophilus TaxID=60036 RepID=A0AAW4L3H4_9BACT|nr:TlpA disulfide reductase family protein [Geoanaerobacter pelophilus]MBT0664055.1 TlpA family protein disulfide reductase [Geoanaerobacter pelophilus]